MAPTGADTAQEPFELESLGPLSREYRMYVVLLDIESGEARIRSKIELVSDSVIMDQQPACTCV